MKRNRLMAAVTGAAVLLAGCSSTSGTAASATPSTSNAAATSSSSMSSSSMSSSMAPASSMSSSMAPVSSMASSEEPTSSPEQSASSSGTASSSVSVASSEDTGSSTSTPPTTTVGNQKAGLDETSTKWFDAFCTGVAPVVTGGKELTKMSSSSSAATQKKTLELFETLGTSLTKTSDTLKGLPAPTFSGGDAFAAKVVKAFGTAGPALSAAAKKIAASPSTPDASAMSSLTESLEKATAPLNDLGSLKLTAATQADFLKIPSCAAVQKAATG